MRPSRAALRPAGRARTVKKRSLDRAGSANTRPNSAGVCSRWSGVNPAVSGSNGAPKRDPLRREASAAFRAPAGENFSSGAGGHASAETVRAFAVQIAGLKSSLHAGYPARAKSSCENKDVGRTGSRALYAARRGAVNREYASPLAQSNCSARHSSLWITAANLLRLTSTP